MGRLVTMVDSGGRTTYSYDANGQLTGKTDVGNLVQAYRYDGTGNRVWLADPDGKVRTYSYDALDQQSKAELPLGTVFLVGYDADGRKTTVSSSVANTLVTYDALNRAITLVQTNGASAPLMTIVDTYDPAGRKTRSVKDNVQADYAYDAIDRQTATTKPGACETFVYDAVGNIRVKWQQGESPRTMTYDTAGRLVTMGYQGGVTAYTFDPAGNMILESLLPTPTSYLYDGENRMTKMTNPDGIVMTSTYQGDGLRWTRQFSAEPRPTTFVWDSSDYLGEVR